jgi:cyclic pyranopterin phosphate synthase
MELKVLESHGRRLRKLRVQLLDNCNYRCTYCMPAEPVFSKSSSWLSASQWREVVAPLRERGVDELRLTGGEPLLRPDFIEVAESLSSLSWRKMGITTNAEKLCEVLPEMKRRTKIDSINVSLDSLDPKRFQRITGRGNFEKVLEGIHMAKAMGYLVKINVVVMRGINDGEWLDFMHFSRDNGILVRFLELMRIGPNNEDLSAQLVPAQEMVRRFELASPLTKVEVPKDHTAFEYKSEDGAHIGFIASETQSFCGQCSRLRLTHEGVLRPCLFKNEGHSLVGLKGQALEDVLQKVALSKPLERIETISQPMYAIGG